ncbi:hypothetical protein BSKO_01374 [Bryopsis sp. KO-2023]|nr:hypothetical protein BSKO_01374 [Bryopsis sp. KO-2023]
MQEGDLYTAPSFNTYLKNAPSMDSNDGSSGDVTQKLLALSSTKVINQRAFGNNVGIPMGGILNCIPQEEAKLPQLNKPPICCVRCGAFINPFCRVEVQAGRWKCVFCESVNIAQDQLGGADLQVSPELTSEAVEYVTNSFQPTIDKGKPQNGAVVIAVDGTLDPENMDPVRHALKSVLKDLHPATEVALLSFDGSISVYNLKSKPGLIEAHTIPGQVIHLPKGARKVLSNGDPIMCKAGSCLPAIELVLDSLSAQQTHLPERDRPRCLGMGIHEALLLIQEWRKNPGLAVPQGQSIPRNERVLVIMGGLGTYGPGAMVLDSNGELVNFKDDPARDGIKMFTRLAAVAQGMGVPVDLFGVGPSSNGVALLEPLGRASGGGLTMHSCVNSAMLAKSIQMSLARTFGTHGLLDVRLSPGLEVTSVIGNVFDRMGSGESGVRKLSSNACTIRNLEVGKAYGLWVEATRDLDQQDLYMQVLLGWKALDGSHVERVVTRKLSPTGNLVDYMKSINPGPASVLMAKKIVLETARMLAIKEKKKAEDIRLGLSTKLAYFAQKFGKLLEKKGVGLFGFGVKQKWSCPQEMSAFAHALYHLQRGPMIGPLPCTSHDRSFLHSTFLSGSVAVGECMLVPKMYEVDPRSFTLQEVPPIDLALRQDSAILLDHGSHMFIWLGASLATQDGTGEKGAAESVGNGHSGLISSLIHACERHAVSLSSSRFPTPELRIVQEGTDDMRWLLSRVVPGRKDQFADQKNQLPRSMSLDLEDTKRSMGRFPISAEPSLYEWCREFGVEPPRQDLARSGSMSGMGSM